MGKKSAGRRIKNWWTMDVGNLSYGGRPCAWEHRGGPGLEWPEMEVGSPLPTAGSCESKNRLNASL
jgi:hypothetical protein